ncbi:D-Ala-D-Ala carboxypeptidase family metallohydrolase [Siccirubricoccus sp. KC 17139]|uniref:D-Ala-D-Ala carboxypeptidase family metallohydrolase n=1 Tax=Siccirubricoccus soli TaxID=2899147 RepID=A0ABT1CYF9_9PROT|nr:D-Ala-D-Ala carboxypeptidase family metallohydrolase [Siccirubricoccus soli]MCO6414703.1 D-Ala-D-Ala carboxypeptidase family metallohydrolase [Siccirubricoccus soli]MCP2680833.1 D-Ala-D-Ala carboxypeptidase family metallohydrolase [Siccirubricoccus soli]
MTKFGVPSDYITSPIGSPEEKAAILALEEAAAQEVGGYRFEATELRIGQDLHLEIRYFPLVAPAAVQLGSLAIRYETSGHGSATVSSGVNDPGGVSYGAFQLKSRESDGSVGGRVAEFLAAEGKGFAPRFTGETPGSPGFTASWKSLAAEQPETLFAAELAFILRTHFEPQAKKVATEARVQVKKRSRALQEAVFSTAVQHGPNTSVVVAATQCLPFAGAAPPNPADFDAALITAIYDERTRRMPDLRRRYDMERADAMRMLAAEDEGGMAAAFAAVATAVPAKAAAAASAKDAEFARWFAEHVGMLADFQPDEFLTLGAANAKNGLNTRPPQELWPNIIPVARLLQALRTKLGQPVVLHSLYRSPAYNKAVGGEPNSQHMRFCAADFAMPGFSSPVHWAGILRGMRSEGVFRGGIGVYPSFVHVDTRGFDADWEGG